LLKDMEREIHIFRDCDALANALAVHVAKVALEAVAAGGRFMIALSGGSAMLLLAEGIRSGATGTPVDWSAWHIFWADERCVPNDSADSNSTSARQALLAQVPIPAAQIHAVDSTLRPPESAREYELRMAKIFRQLAGEWPRFDLILLGVGPDGHTASLFPGNPAVSETERWVAPVFGAPKPPPERVTLTLPVINRARQICFVATGADKAPVLARILRAGDSSKVQVPAARVRLSDGAIHWFIDQAAASALNSKGIP
jgi:6-phosphogluconolactonase